MQTLILNHYPPVIKQIGELQQIAKAEDIEFSKLNALFGTVSRNMFVTTADETGVQRFEKLLGIKPKVMQSLEDRKLYILIMINRRKMSLHEIAELLSEYAKEIKLKPSYEKDEITVEAGDNASDISTLFKVLDEMIPLHIYIFFFMEIVTKTECVETPLALELETTVNWENAKGEWYLDGSVPLDGSRLLGAAKNEWYLDGSVPLDGSRFLNAAIISKKLTELELKMESTVETATEIFKDMELTEQKNLWYLDGSVSLDGSRMLNAEIHKEAI